MYLQLFFQLSILCIKWAEGMSPPGTYGGSRGWKKRKKCFLEGLCATLAWKLVNPSGFKATPPDLQLGNLEDDLLAPAKKYLTKMGVSNMAKVLSINMATWYHHLKETISNDGTFGGSRETAARQITKNGSQFWYEIAEILKTIGLEIEEDVE